MVKKRKVSDFERSMGALYTLFGGQNIIVSFKVSRTRILLASVKGLAFNDDEDDPDDNYIEPLIWNKEQESIRGLKSNRPHYIG